MPVGDMTRWERISMIAATVIIIPAVLLTFVSWQVADGPGSSFALMVFIAFALGVRWYREYDARQP